MRSDPNVRILFTAEAKEMRHVPLAQSRWETPYGGALRMFTVRADSECGNKVCHVSECLPLVFYENCWRQSKDALLADDFY